MKICYCLLCLVAASVLVSCKDKQESVTRVSKVFKEDTIPARPHAKIMVPKEVDMGVFQGNEMIKTIDVKVENAGEDTLYINYLSPECDCTEVSVVDSAVAPGAATVLHAKLDLSGYPADTISKRFSIISNSLKDHVATITLKGEVK